MQCLQSLPARDSNSQPLDYESGSLTIRPRLPTEISIRSYDHCAFKGMYTYRSLNCIFVKIQIAERKVVTAVVEIVGVSNEEDRLTLLSSDFEEFSVSPDLYQGSLEDLIESLPVKLEIKHIHQRAVDISLVNP